MINCCNHPEPEIRMKAVVTLQLLSRNDENKDTLVKNKALEVLVGLLKVENNREYTHRYAAIALCDLISGSDDRKLKIAELGIIPTLATLLSGSSFLQDGETKYWSLMVTHQLASCERIHPMLVKEGFIPILANMSWQTFGSSAMPKYCLQALVRIISNMKPEDSKKELTKLLDCNIVRLLSACLRNSVENADESELLYWSIRLLHEFVVKARFHNQVVDEPGLIDTILGMLEDDDDQDVQYAAAAALYNLSSMSSRYCKSKLSTHYLVNNTPTNRGSLISISSSYDRLLGYINSLLIFTQNYDVYECVADNLEKNDKILYLVKLLMELFLQPAVKQWIKNQIDKDEGFSISVGDLLPSVETIRTNLKVSEPPTPSRKTVEVLAMTSTHIPMMAIAEENGTIKKVAYVKRKELFLVLDFSMLCKKSDVVPGFEFDFAIRPFDAANDGEEIHNVNKSRSRMRPPSENPKPDHSVIPVADSSALVPSSFKFDFQPAVSIPGVTDQKQPELTTGFGCTIFDTEVTFIPLLYYEVEMGLKGVDSQKCFQVGLTITSSSTHLLCGYMDHYFLVSFRFHKKFEDPLDFDAWLVGLLKNRIENDKDLQTEYQGHAAFVKMYTNLKLKDGDCIGWGVFDSKEPLYSECSNLDPRKISLTCFFTLNGSVVENGITDKLFSQESKFTQESDESISQDFE
ncbi:16852_t:CDS:10, partial [Acaulospora colombiana]